MKWFHHRIRIRWSMREVHTHANDHLSNYLFMGIDSSEEVSNMESQMDAGQAGFHLYRFFLDRAD